jgi:subtilisin
LKRVRLLSIVAACATLVMPALTSTAGAAPETGKYIVVLRDTAAAASVADAHADRFGADVSHVYRHALKGYAAEMSAGAAARIADLPVVRWVEQDRPVRVAAQPLPTGINRVDAELSPTAKINNVDERVNVDVAVLDTGAANHVDLNINRAGAKDCINPLGNASDLHGHGTHVSGTVAALDNNDGVVGVAPGARIWPVKVLTDAGSGLVSHIVCGIDYVTSKAGQIEVANMSLTGGGSDDNNCGNTNNDSEHRAICRAVNAGITFVVAAGNNSRNASAEVPAAYDEVITVSSLADFNGLPGGGAAATCTSDVDDTLSSFSNFGADVDLIAPGSCIRSTGFTGGYATMSGTSMASPHVAGGAALYKANNPGATPAQVKSALQTAGTLDWNNSDDRDGIKEKLLNVATL